MIIAGYSDGQFMEYFNSMQIPLFWNIRDESKKRYVNVRKLQGVEFHRLFRAVPSIKVASKPQPSILFGKLWKNINRNVIIHFLPSTSSRGSF